MKTLVAKSPSKIAKTSPKRYSIHKTIWLRRIGLASNLYFLARKAPVFQKIEKAGTPSEIAVQY